MNKKWSILVVFFLFSHFVSAQERSLFPCGTVAAKSLWLKEYQRGQIDFRDDEETMYVPLAIHIVGDDYGLGYYRYYQVMESVCRLNTDFAEANIVFYIEGDIDYIDSTIWYAHDSILQGAEMMFQNNREHALNCYFLDDPAGNCGYNLPYGGIALAKSCLGEGSHTWAHETGHALSLPHPFLGWEGGVSYDGSVGHSYSDPAPTEVYYDYTLFKDTLYLDTLIIDTALVELVDGSNCAIAADGFCDTSPDYLYHRWLCDENAVSEIEQTDPAGVKFYSDATLIMAYPLDSCQSRFSPGQIEAMRAYLLDVKTDWLDHETPLAQIAGTTELLVPANNQEVQYENVLLTWSGVPNATDYYLKLYKKIGSQGITTVGKYTIHNDTSLLLTDLHKNKTYYWEVKPTNRYSYCASFSVRDTFFTVEETVGINDFVDKGFSVFPTIVSAGKVMTVLTPEETGEEINIRLIDIAGNTILTTIKNRTGKNRRWTFPIPQVPEGMYIVAIGSGGQQVYKKIFVR